MPLRTAMRPVQLQPRFPPPFFSLSLSLPPLFSTCYSRSLPSSSSPSTFTSTSPLHTPVSSLLPLLLTPPLYLSLGPTLSQVIPLPTLALSLSPAPAFVSSVYRPIHRRLAQLTQEINAIEPGVVYVYPYSAFHSTVACIVNFMHNQQRFTAAVRERYLRVWTQVMRGCLGDRQQAAGALRTPRRPFRLRIGSPDLSSKAGFFPLLNPSGEVTAVRHCVRHVMVTHSELLAQVPPLPNAHPQAPSRRPPSCLPSPRLRPQDPLST